MQTSPVISFQGVSKRFTFSKDTPSSVLESLISFTRKRGEEDALWAVKDVSFDVHAGESVGLIGRNGSGKSTLLKLATRILKPTSGKVAVNGRISALLELGAGFHDDLSGRENIYLNASVLGLSKQEVDERFDSIVAFSELEKFIDMPVKHYSSGMYMRLGFSVAVHCDPDILLVDEILAVGDRAFQRKCIDHIYQMKRNGVTIVMVSHHLETLQKLCDSLVWMDQGDLREIGPTELVVGHYVEHMNSRIDQQRGAAATFNRSGSYEAEILDVQFLNKNDEPQTVFKTGDLMTIEMSYVAHQPIFEPEMGFAIFREDGVHINGPNNRIAGLPIDVIKGEGKLRYRIKNLSLLPGAYIVSAAIQASEQPHSYDFHVRAYSFQVEAGGTKEFHGVVAFPAMWEWEPLSEPDMAKSSA